MVRGTVHAAEDLVGIAREAGCAPKLGREREGQLTNNSFAKDPDELAGGSCIRVSRISVWKMPESNFKASKLKDGG